MFLAKTNAEIAKKSLRSSYFTSRNDLIARFMFYGPKGADDTRMSTYFARKREYGDRSVRPKHKP